MPNNNFTKNVMRGNVGERFVYVHLNDLCDYVMLNQNELPEMHIEGADETAHRIRLGNPIDNFLPDYVVMPEMQNGTFYEVTEYSIGGIEVKTSWDYLAKTYDRENEAGTLPIALWSSDTREHAGWLLKLLHPERYSATNDGLTAVQPHTLLFILAAYENAFASIAFENIPAFLDRLRQIAGEAGIDIDDGIPFGEQAQDWSPESLLLFGNMWLVSLDDLEDLAKVTIIGEKPRMRPDIVMQDRSCASSTQEKRYERLLEIACERQIPIEDEFRNCFHPSRKRQVFADINHNLSILENFEDEKYPTLAIYRRQRVFQHLNGIMLNMLAHEFPVYLQQSQRYFMIGKLQLEDWCKRHGIPGSAKSWQGSLIFLNDCGLIKCFRPVEDNTTPSLERIYSSILPISGKYPTLRSVPRYNDTILRHAEHIAQIYYSKHVALTKLTKTDVIRCRGQEVADSLYLDGRKISGEELYVYELYKQVMVCRIQANGYAEKDEILEQVNEIMIRKQHFQCIICDHILNEKESNELNRQTPFWDAYKKIKERTAQLAADAGYTYHPIRNIDRERFHLPDTMMNWIIS